MKGLQSEKDSRAVESARLLQKRTESSGSPESGEDKWALGEQCRPSNPGFLDLPPSRFLEPCLCLFWFSPSLSLSCFLSCPNVAAVHHLQPLLLAAIPRLQWSTFSVAAPQSQLSPRDHSVRYGFRCVLEISSCGGITYIVPGTRCCCDRLSEKSSTQWTVSEFGAFGKELELLVIDMANCARGSAGGAPEQMTMLDVGASATPGETSSFYTALEECLSSRHDVAIGDCTNAGSSMERKSEYFSPRVEEMMQSKNQFSSDVEYEIEHSKVHWSEMLDVSELSEDSTDHEEVNVENEKAFAELANDPQWNHDRFGHFFRELSFSWKLGRKIAEGGQAAIFEITKNHQTAYAGILLKVFKRGSRLSDLKKQWPTGILQRDLGTCITSGGFLLEDGRFAFVMSRCWGDLRKLIDQAMQEKNNQGPPFPYEWKGWTWHVREIMLMIAADMAKLHKYGIIHRDLKAANVLLSKGSSYKTVFVADYECSIGVVGTGFWRAPEILLALKNRTSIDFNEKVDVYSYGMTCFEVLTGRLPFEGELEACRASYDLVMEGQRPKLPNDLDVQWKFLIERCWNPIPSERPSFKEIWQVLHDLSNDGCHCSKVVVGI